MEAYYGLVPNGSTPFYTYFETTGRNHLTLEKPFASAVDKQTYLNFNSAFDIDASALKELSLDEVKEKYHFDSQLVRIKKDGRDLRPADAWEAIPESVKTMWNRRNEESWNDFSQDLYYTDIVKELISPEYISQNEYIQSQLRAHFYALDELAATLVYEVMY